jgi:hypothetical protein
MMLPTNNKINSNIIDKIQGFYEPYLTNVYLNNNPNATLESLEITDFSIFDSRINFKNRNGFVISKANNNPNEPWWFIKHSNHGVILQTQSPKIVSDKWQYYNNNNPNHSGTHNELIGSIIFSMGTINKVIQTPPTQNAPPVQTPLVHQDIVNNILNNSMFQKKISDLTERKIIEFSKSNENIDNILNNSKFKEFSKSDENIDNILDNSKFMGYVSDSTTNMLTEFGKSDQNINNILDNSKFKKYIRDSTERKINEFSKSGKNANNIFRNNIFRRNINHFANQKIFEASKSDEILDNILNNSKFQEYISDFTSNKYYELNESNDNVMN